MGWTVAGIAVVILLAVFTFLRRKSGAEWTWYAEWQCSNCGSRYDIPPEAQVPISTEQAILSTGMEGFRVGPTLTCGTCGATTHFSRDGSEFEVKIEAPQ